MTSSVRSFKAKAKAKAKARLFNAQQTLPRRLLLSLLPVVVIPLLLAGGLGYTVSRTRGRDSELQRLQQDSSVVSLTTKSIVKSRQDIIEVIRQSPEVLALFAKATATVESNGLKNLNLNQSENLEAVEQKFAGSLHQLEPNPKINAYLKQLLQSDGVAEITITDRYGYTLAAGEPTSDFVQSDEAWWKAAKVNGSFIDKPEFDEASQQSVVATAREVFDATGKDGLGIIRLGIKTDFFQQELAKFVQQELHDTESLQLVDSASGNVVTTISKENVKRDAKTTQKLMGGGVVQQISTELVKANLGGFDAAGVKAFQQKLEQMGGFTLVKLSTVQKDKEFRIDGALIQQGDRYYSLHVVEGTDLVAVGSESSAAVEATGRELLAVFSSTSFFLSVAGIFFALLLARQLAKPLIELTRTAEAVADGKFDLRVEAQGTAETRSLALTFNRLLDQVQGLLKQQEDRAVEQSRQREELEQDVMQLMEDVGDASEGDLTVRAQLSAGDVGIVADLFNSIIENLRDTAMQVKGSAGQVSMSLDVNAEGIRSLATQAIAEANSLRQTMQSVEEVSASIQTVANNAEAASKLTDESYSAVQDGSEYMDRTVDSILNLRSTVGETAKKIKRLGESAQKISQTVSLIDEIALKTNLLAVNASVEAARAGELGQGFTAVAEQVGALAEQSAAATKEIAQIVAAIQAETQEVIGAIETGTAQVVDSTLLVESTKQRLTQVLQKSAQINQLMRSISTSTIAQTAAASVVTSQVKSATQESEQRAKASEQMAKAIQDTAEIARSLQESVAQFKVDDKFTPTPAPGANGNPNRLLTPVKA
jgi:methyl-accepting chemotaxis protein PixJ